MSVDKLQLWGFLCFISYDITGLSLHLLSTFFVFPFAFMTR